MSQDYLADAVYVAPEGADPIDITNWKEIGYVTDEGIGDAFMGETEVGDIEALSTLEGRTITLELPSPAASAFLAQYASETVEHLDAERGLNLVVQELDRATAKFGRQDLPVHREEPARPHVEGYRQLADWHRSDNDYRAVAGGLTWDTILLEEVYEALAEADGSDELGVELIQVAAVALRIWLSQQRKKLTDEDRIAVLRRLLESEAAVREIAQGGGDVA